MPTKKATNKWFLGPGGLAILFCSFASLWAAASGSISGTLRDPSGLAVSGATVRLINTALRSEFKAVSNGQGFYSFPTLPVGHYDLTIQASGFTTQKKTNVTLDTDAALKFDVVLALGLQSDTVTVEADRSGHRSSSGHPGHSSG